ncbi:hypothetical protein HYP93_gp41 [Stenotrophomonas phage Pokken]|uniref:Uncharacterized protein n=1 Tax=Stenotrophomonas phage Pokken TaxID=2596674 RepID=A0A5B9N9N1_9CAUD|nr:hypothetical protein HYP93_gp41 [Stenotrophomonas phage Pokken]QEG09316.1 hypothetical protein CPT_Pokken_098 [Stenotrophomonas phage Pokken]
MFTHQEYNEANRMEQEVHEASLAESEARVRVLNAQAFVWVSIAIAALVAAFAYAI